MKLTKEDLIKMIKEELDAVLSEQEQDVKWDKPEVVRTTVGTPPTAEEIALLKNLKSSAASMTGGGAKTGGGASPMAAFSPSKIKPGSFKKWKTQASKVGSGLDLEETVKEELEDRWFPKVRPLTTSSGEVYAYEPPEEWLGVESPSRQMSILGPAIDLSAVEDPGEPMVSQDLEAMAALHFPDTPYPSHLPTGAEMPETKAQELDQALADAAEAERLKRKKIRHLTVTQDEKGEMASVPKEKWIPVYENKIKITKQDLAEIIKKQLTGLFESEAEAKKHKGKPGSDFAEYPMEENKKTEVTKKGQERVSKKIGHLVGKEGKSQEQAAAIAYSMEDRGELKKGGKHSV
jgi:hypothetical protein